MQAALTTNCEAVLAHAQSRKAYRGTILLAPTSEAQEERQQPSQSGNTASHLGDQPSAASSATQQNQVVKTHSAGKAAAPMGANKQRKRKSR